MYGPADRTAAGGAALAQPSRGLTHRTGATAVGLAAVALAVVVLAPLDDGRTAVRLAGVAIPIAFGLFRLSREPDDRFAGLLVAAGAMFSLTTLAETGDSALYSLGRASVWILEAVLVYLVLAFPHGRLNTREERRLVAAVAVLVGTLYLPTVLFAQFPQPSPWSGCRAGCPPNAFDVTTGAGGFFDGAIRPLREVLSVILFAWVTAAVIRRMRTRGPLLAWVLAPVAAVAVLRTVTLGGYFVARRSGDVSGVADAFGWAYVMSLPAVTLAFAVGIVAHRLFVADALERLTRTFASRPNARELRDALSNALHDPALEMRFCVPDSPSGWVDTAGWPTVAPTAAPTRAVTEVSDRDHTLAAIVHDRELSYDRALLDGVASYTATALENRELVGELRASLEELTESRARLVSVADEERRKIERDLHDGAQQRLVALQIKLALLADELERESTTGADRVRGLESEIEETLDEIRRFGRGVYPPLLADRGLSDALHAVARTAPIPTTVDARLPHRYPREVESAVYFACLEALQNVAKHARGATAASISISGNSSLRFDVRDNGAGFEPRSVHSGAGLANMRDRIVAVGGEVAVTSQPGRGTRVTGVVPIA